MGGDSRLLRELKEFGEAYVIAKSIRDLLRELRRTRRRQRELHEDDDD